MSRYFGVRGCNLKWKEGVWPDGIPPCRRSLETSLRNENLFMETLGFVVRKVLGLSRLFCEWSLDGELLAALALMPSRKTLRVFDVVVCSVVYLALAAAYFVSTFGRDTSCLAVVNQDGSLATGASHGHFLWCPARTLSHGVTAGYAKPKVSSVVWGGMARC